MPLDRDAERLQPLDQQSLVLVLGEDVEEGVGRQAGADSFKREPRRRFTLDPKIDGGDLVARRDHGLGEIELAVEFERAGLHRQSARGRTRLGGLVDNAHIDAELGQPKCQHQTRRARADDKNIASHDLLLHVWLLKWNSASRMPERKVGSANNSRGAAGVRKRQASVRHAACIDLAGYPSQDCASAGDLMIITVTAPIAGTQASRWGSISGPRRGGTSAGDPRTYWSYSCVTLHRVGMYRSMILAASGVLNDRPATTKHEVARNPAARGNALNYPRIDVRGMMLVDRGGNW